MGRLGAIDEPAKEGATVADPHAEQAARIDEPAGQSRADRRCIVALEMQVAARAARVVGLEAELAAARALLPPKAPTGFMASTPRILSARRNL